MEDAYTMQPTERLSKLFNIFSDEPVEVHEIITRTISGGQVNECHTATLDDDDVCLKALRSSLAGEGYDLSVMLVTPGATESDMFMQNSVKAYVKKDEKGAWRVKGFRMG